MPSMTTAPDIANPAEWLRKYDSALAGSMPALRHSLLTIAGDFLKYAERQPIDKAVVFRYLERLRRQGYSDGSVNKAYRIVARLLKLNGLEILARKDAPLIRETHVNAPALHPDVIRDMILARAQLPDRHAAFLAMGTVFGLRRSEILGLTKASFDWTSNLVFVASLKGSRQRYHSIPSEIREVLQAYDWDQVVTPYQANKVLWDIGEAVGVPLAGTEANWHAIRRTLDTLLLDQPGLSEAAVRDFLRWKAAGMTARYYSARRFVGREGVTMVMGASEKEQDEKIFAVHPFLPCWKSGKSRSVRRTIEEESPNGTYSERRRQRRSAGNSRSRESAASPA